MYVKIVSKSVNITNIEKLKLPTLGGKHANVWKPIWLKYLPSVENF